MTAWDDAVEAAATARANWFEALWQDIDESSRDFYRTDAANELRAALPHLLAPIRELLGGSVEATYESGYIDTVIPTGNLQLVIDQLEAEAKP